MDYVKDITNHQKGKHFSLGDRRELQGILSNSSNKYSLRQLAKHFNCAPNTIRNELKRGARPHTGRYGAARAHRSYLTSHSNSIHRSKRFLTSGHMDYKKSVVRTLVFGGLSWLCDKQSSISPQRNCMRKDPI